MVLEHYGGCRFMALENGIDNRKTIGNENLI
jgi:hypothetical protein